MTFPLYFLFIPFDVANIADQMFEFFNCLSILNSTGLVAKVEKNLSDHTEFLNYKNEMDKWLAKANETLESCFGIGTENETKQKMEAVTVSVNNCVATLFFTFRSSSYFVSDSIIFFRLYRTASQKVNTSLAWSKTHLPKLPM